MLNHAVVIHNCTVSDAIDFINPYASLLSTPLDNFEYRVFGWAAYVQSAKETHTSELDDHGKLGVYKGTVNGLYCIYVLESKRVTHSKHVLFYKEIFTN